MQLGSRCYRHCAFCRVPTLGRMKQHGSPSKSRLDLPEQRPFFGAYPMLLVVVWFLSGPDTNAPGCCPSDRRRQRSLQTSTVPDICVGELARAQPALSSEHAVLCHKYSGRHRRALSASVFLTSNTSSGELQGQRGLCRLLRFPSRRFKHPFCNSLQVFLASFLRPLCTRLPTPLPWPQVTSRRRQDGLKVRCWWPMLQTWLNLAIPAFLSC